MSTAIITHQTLDGFFDELMKDALAKERLVLSESTASYLLRLMADFGQPEALFGGCKPEEPGTPALVWLYERAVTAGPKEQFHHYRQLGDVSLFVSGFFSQHLERSLVDADYYARMGCSAYDRAASLATGAFHEVFEQLAATFDRVVDVLTRIAEQTTLPVPQDVMSLYQRWSRSGGEDLSRRLARAGAFPVFGQREVA